MPRSETPIGMGASGMLQRWLEGCDISGRMRAPLYNRLQEVVSALYHSLRSARLSTGWMPFLSPSQPVVKVVM